MRRQGRAARLSVRIVSQVAERDALTPAVSSWALQPAAHQRLDGVALHRHAGRQHLVAGRCGGEGVMVGESERGVGRGGSAMQQYAR